MMTNMEFEGYWYEKGIEYYNKKAYETAIRCFNRSLEHTSNNEFEVWYMKGNAFYHLQQYNEAIYCFNKSLA
ncbi:MAG TPA: tetratricopeptide repeat protein [Candidatus Saccharimonadales bacterium]|nr:tetratricopeptide repeat protein [Candidatus Saccharimonadales bacterium]